MKKLLTAFSLSVGLLLSSFDATAAFEATVHIKKIEVYTDRIILELRGPTFGAQHCIDNNKDRRWGWPTSSPASDNWYALALSAQAQELPVRVHKIAQNCIGLSDGTSLDGLFLEKN
ncbi:hypothetical protein [Pseudoalteromonas luteoviolacea]|uniref:Uncharacterized protein n=1 Tax=Pseudoalteromonas luteoviolacea S4054 TaxID=1129367 RepID=A0A0F6A4J2_9GAMM|nr:hypothetical protein [Pseudoalteromonas luteoviolacea]AOT11076.1 hypothetical protein S4054249_24900 [Pseudoalteromonas luteoviolacea]AOT15760.1 hypothetical protein S40542_23610 [Pseudoalteromonas luteoviolacea]AOT20897.1 hypothetical protein S4054_24820 [Pseudoalteromonas luteoviolacea]KKE80988.1 hypothetical protein N479_24070 [Pseudoalteromonas luteoviolacea S4054]KZN74551.1 hypothetical protein N481_09005 [Pseudoalteromonas luteoviolacea S4047-1]